MRIREFGKSKFHPKVEFNFSNEEKMRKIKKDIDEAGIW